MQEMQKIKIPYDYSGSSSIRRRLLLRVLFIFFSLLALFAIKKSLENSPPISSLFYQPHLTDKIDWDESFQEMQACQIKTLIVQWSQFGVVDFIKKDSWLKEIFSQAQKHHIHVVMGLYGDDHYFKKLESSQTDRNRYFKKLLQCNTTQAKRIYSIAKHYKEFKGWYIYDEIDESNFATKERVIQLREYLQNLATNLEKISPQPRYISGYFSNHMQPKKYAEMLSYITQKRYTLLLQSGIGANLVNVEQSKKYMLSFNENFKGNYIPIVEGFKMVNSNVVSSDFCALKEQIKMIKEASDQRELSLFSLRYFLNKKLPQAYREAYVP